MKKGRKTVKPERIPYRFTILKEQEEEIINFLNSIPKPLRGKVIVEGLKVLKKNYDSPGVEGQTNTIKAPPPELNESFDL